MSTRTRMVVVVALVAATVAVGASVIAGLRGAGGPAAPAGPEVADAPAPHSDPDYWTEERMRDAKPVPMPQPPAGG